MLGTPPLPGPDFVPTSCPAGACAQAAKSDAGPGVCSLSGGIEILFAAGGTVMTSFCSAKQAMCFSFS